MAGQGSFGIVFKVPVGNGLFAARKVFDAIPHGETKTPACQAEYTLLKRARDEKAGNVVQLLPIPATSTDTITGGRVDREGHVRTPKGN